MTRFLLISLPSVVVGVAIAYLFVYMQPEYLVEEAQISPGGTYLATRFMEAGVFVACNEVVIVTPKDMPFQRCRGRAIRPHALELWRYAARSTCFLRHAMAATDPEAVLH